MASPESQFEWHEEKNRANIRKHGIRFEDAVRILGPGALLLRTRTREEVRWKALDLLAGRVIAVIFTERADRKRIISARPASRSERRA